MQITDLYVYPIKSLAGIRLEQAKLSETGIQFDRYWMLVKPNGMFITQREIPKLVLFYLELTEETLKVSYQDKMIAIPKKTTHFEELECELFGNKVLGYKESDEISNWFSSI